VPSLSRHALARFRIREKGIVMFLDVALRAGPLTLSALKCPGAGLSAAWGRPASLTCSDRAGGRLRWYPTRIRPQIGRNGRVPFSRILDVKLRSAALAISIAATPRRRRRPRVAPHPAQRAHHTAGASRARRFTASWLTGECNRFTVSPLQARSQRQTNHRVRNF